MIYSVVLVSAVQQSESVIHIHISTLFFFLAASDLIFGTWDLSLRCAGSSLQCTGFFLVVARGLQSRRAQ